MSDESALLTHIFRRSAGMEARFPWVLAGPGDDCAALRAADLGSVVLAKVDQLVEGRHYDPRVTSVDLIARKAVARAVSDVAAMGGAPRAALAAAALRDGFDQEDELFDAMHAWAEHWECPLVGGDIARVAGPTVISVSVLAAAPPRGVVGRRGARPGDGVYITGRIGGSYASGRHLTFTPRLIEGRWLCDTLADRLTAMMDVSDGLGRDAARIAAASGVRIEIDAAAIPRHADAPDPLRAAADGEDHELLFTAAASPGAACPITGVSLTRIGEVVAGAGCAIRSPGGAWLDASSMGWEHRG